MDEKDLSDNNKTDDGVELISNLFHEYANESGASAQKYIIEKPIDLINQPSQIEAHLTNNFGEKQETIQQLVQHEEEEEIEIVKPIKRSWLFSFHKELQDVRSDAVKLEFVKRIDTMNKLLFSIAVGVGVIVIINLIIMVNSFITNQKLKRIEKIIAEAEILAKDNYTPEERLEFVLNIKEELNKINYYENNHTQKVYALNDGTFIYGDITLTPKIVNTVNNTENMIPISIKKETDTKFIITGNNPQANLTPGKYALKVEIEKSGAKGTIIQNFSWGVLAINTNKSVYLPGDLAKIQMAVLNDKGEMVCNAEVTLSITDPNGITDELSTNNKLIKVNDGCRKKEFIWEPDYEAKYHINNLIGLYKIHLKAKTDTGFHEMDDLFEVKSSVSYDIERLSSTRIFPTEKYPMIFKVTADKDYIGEVKENVPRDFKIFSVNKEDIQKFAELNKNKEINFIQNMNVQNIETLSEDDLYRNISWEVSLEKGKTYYFGYWYDVPDKSPNFFSLGTLKIENFEESRYWQIAVDFITSLHHASVFTDTDDTSACATIDVYQTVPNTTISHATLNSAGFGDTENVLVIADFYYQGNNANAVYCMRLATTGGTAVPYSDTCREARTSTARVIHQRILVKTTKTSGQGFLAQKAYHTASQTSPYIRKVSIVIIGLDNLTSNEDYVWGENTSTGNIPANGSIGTYANISTPASDPDWDGDVLVLDYFNVDANTVIGSDSIMHELQQDSNASKNLSRLQSEDLDERYGGGGIYLFSQPDASSHTYKVKLQNSDASTNSFAHYYSSIIAFPAKLFEEVQYGQTDGTYNTGNTSFNSVQSIAAFNPTSSGDYLVLGHVIAQGSGASNPDNMRMRVQLGGTDIPSGWDDTIHGVYLEQNADGEDLNIATIQSFDTSSKSIDVQAATSATQGDFTYRQAIVLSMGLSFVDLSGTAYTNDDEIATLNSYSICLAINAYDDTDNCNTTNGSGQFTISKAKLHNNDQLTLFIDNATVHGNIVSKSTIPSSNISGLKMYQNHVLIRNEQAGALAIVDMDAYDNDQNATDMIYDADTSPDTLALEYDSELFITTGKTFAPGGSVDGHDTEIVGTWTAATNETINLDGTFKLDAGGTFTSSTSTVTFDGTGGIEDLITDGTGSLYNLVLNDAGGSLTIEVEDPLVVANNLTITGGTLDTKTGENNQITLGGNWDNDDTFEAQSGIVLFNKGSGTATIDADGIGSNNADAFYNVIFNDSAGSATYQLTTEMYVDNDLTITGGTLDSNGNTIQLAGNWTNDDIFNESTATVNLISGKSATLDTGCVDSSTCTNQNFYNININKGLGGDIVTLADELRVTNTFTITAGEFIQTTGDVQLEGTTSLQLYDLGRYTNISTGDLTLGGNVVNDSGAITLNSNGYGCGEAKDIVIASTSTSQRSWSGNGAFRLADVAVSYQTGSTIIKAASSTDSGNNGANWIFTVCGLFEAEGIKMEGIKIN